MDWTERETISAFLKYRPPQGGAHWVSCLIAVLRDARQATGRNLNTGEVEPEEVERVGCWLGAVGYMTMFDLVGSVFKPAHAIELAGQPFIRTLQYFAPEIGEVERDALYSLRCSFVHDFSLVNVPATGSQQARERRTHHFMLNDADETGPIVKLPPQRWDGDLNHVRLLNATWVNLRSLGDLAEEVYKELVMLHDNGELVLALSGGLDELKRRYAMTVRPGLRLQEP
ncbi:hypothetical protein [Amycolatopsis samaneae]|uniref:Uncharacterized protein n=1 Tax=Amycolatopsis samaneae TaxID=664691 RepID=A0ABW5GB13_9PSEU